MARYRIIDTNPRLLPFVLTQQLIPGTFEHALNHLLDNEIDLSGFDGRYCNDPTGAPAYPPAMLLKVVLFAHSRGIVSSRGIEAACQQHVTFIALCGDNLRHNKGLNRFTLRGRKTVDAQWKMFCLVQNIEKLARHGYAQ